MQSEATKQANDNSPTGLSLLVVEDSPTQAVKLRHLLQEHNYEVQVARNGQEALDALRAHPVELVLSDVEMPVMDGYEMCRLMKSAPDLKHIPVLLLTSLSAPRDVIKALDCGANSFMVKPYVEEQLLARIHYMMGNHAAGPAVDGGVERELAGANAELQQLSLELRAKNEHMQADLNLAREIQSSFIPRQYPSFPHEVPPSQSALGFCHRWIPTTTLGGDFFDVLALTDTTAGVFICDVMGHGVRSALVTAMMRALVGERTSVATDPGAFMRELNVHLIGILQETSTPLFASAFYMVADVTTGELRYANAGHPSPYWMRRRAGLVEALPGASSAAGPVLGLFGEAEYETSQCLLEEGDAVVLFTDGLFEVESPEVEGQEEEYGEERLREAIQGRLTLPLPPLFDALMAEVQNFSGCDDFEDDVCLLGMEITRVRSG